MKVTTKTVAALVLVLLFVLGTMRLWHRIAPGNEVTRARPGAAWRVPGGIGAKAGGAATVAGVIVPPWFGQRGAPIRRIAGRVTFAGQPVANASVELGSELTDARLIPPAKRKTGPDGRFDFGTQPPAKFSVAATAEGHGPAIVEADTRNPTTATDKLELRLGGCESSLFGHVSDSSGGPIASAQVCLAPPRATACVIADGAGAYSICLSHRQDFVSVGAVGYGGIYDRVDFIGRRVQRDYSLTPEAVLVGRVVRADNNAPVARASVRVSAIDDQQRFAAPGATTTDAQGKFTVAGLAPGRQRIVAFADGLATSEALEINAEAGRQSGEVVLRLKPAARISGVVTDGRDPIVGATVSLGNTAMPGPVDAVTQGDGSFVLDPVARGRATIFVSEHEVQDPKVLVIDRAEVSGVRVLVANMGSIAGRVSAAGKPLAGARVNCGRVEPAYTEEDGSYLVRGLAPDHYRVYGDNPATGAFGYAASEVTLARGEHRTGVDIDVKYNGGISGVVVEPDGKPVGGVMVAFQGVHIPDGGNDVTAPDGTFWARDLLGGDDYRASVRTNARNFTKLRMQEPEGPIINVKDGTTDVKGVRLVVVRDHLAISGTTVDGDGQPLGDVRVIAGSSDEPSGALNGWVDHPSAISAADGSFSIADLDSGNFVLQARGGDGSEGVLRGVPAGQKGVLVKVQRAGGIDGTLVGFASQPGVQAQRQIPGVFQPPVFATVDGDTFHFRGLSPGSYQIAAFGTDSDAQMVDVVAGQIATATLKSRGTATIRGHVVEWPSGAPVPGLRCSPGLRTSPSMPMWDPSSSAYCDDDGAFVIDNAPAGAVAVTCFGTGPSYSNGRAELTVTAGQDATCEIPVVKIAPDAQFGSIGAQIQPGPMPARFMTVTPHGTA
ncbi:MAG TPA: carboxypeptidase-like regulatory domain-containing protein, partial [Polyangia bacterium]